MPKQVSVSITVESDPVNVAVYVLGRGYYFPDNAPELRASWILPEQDGSIALVVNFEEGEEIRIS